MLRSGMIMDGPVEIREAGPAETAVIARIIQDSFSGQAEAQGIRREEFPRYAAFTDEEAVLRAREKGNRMVLLYLGEMPIGGIWHALDRKDPQLGHVNKLTVLPGFRGRGYGEMLFAHAEAQLRAQGARRARLTCNARFPGLHAYYERLGYRKVKQEAWTFLPFEVLTMEKDL